MDRLRFVLGAIIGGVLGFWLFGVVGMVLGAVAVGLLFAVVTAANSKRRKARRDSAAMGMPWGEAEDAVRQNSGGKKGWFGAFFKGCFMPVAGIILAVVLLYSCVDLLMTGDIRLEIIR